MCVHMWTGMCAPVCAQAKGRCQTPYPTLLPFIFSQRVSHWPGTHQLGYTWAKPLESSVSDSQDQDYKCALAHPAFPMGVVNLNSGPHAYTESILPSEHLPSPWKGFIFERIIGLLSLSHAFHTDKIITTQLSLTYKGNNY